MAKDKMVKSYGVWNSGGSIYVVSGQLTDGTWFLGNYGDESIISIYKTEDAMLEGMGEYGDDFLRNLSPRNPLSKQIYAEIFKAEMERERDGRTWWHDGILKQAMREYDHLMHDEKLLNELDVWEKEVR